MDLFSLLLIFILVFFIVIPLFRVGMAVYRARRQMREFARRVNNFGNNPYGNRSGGETPRQENPKPRKKIDPSVGEYVSFEEIAVSRVTTGDTGSKGKTRQATKTESQIVDVEWEDI